MIGNGNVALDVARILLSPLSHLQKYDINEEVLEVLKRSGVEHVSIVGRRGWREAAFSGKEVTEMMGMERVGFVRLKEDVLREGGEGLTRPQKREGSMAKFGTMKKTWSLDFMRQPVGLFPAPSSPSLSIASHENQYQYQIPTHQHHHPLHLHLKHIALHPTTQRPTGTGVLSILPIDLMISSLGFEGERVGVWFDSGGWVVTCSEIAEGQVTWRAVSAHLLHACYMPSPLWSVRTDGMRAETRIKHVNCPVECTVQCNTPPWDKYHLRPQFLFNHHKT